MKGETKGESYSMREDGVMQGEGVARGRVGRDKGVKAKTCKEEGWHTCS